MSRPDPSPWVGTQATGRNRKVDREAKRKASEKKKLMLPAIEATRALSVAMEEWRYDFDVACGNVSSDDADLLSTACEVIDLDLINQHTVLLEAAKNAEDRAAHLTAIIYHRARINAMRGLYGRDGIPVMDAIPLFASPKQLHTLQDELEIMRRIIQDRLTVYDDSENNFILQHCLSLVGARIAMLKKPTFQEPL